MPVIVRHGGGAEMEALNFELAGVLDVSAALQKNGINAVQEFLQVGHPGIPGGTNKPGMVLSVAPELKAKGRNDIPYGVFLATKEANPETGRTLRSRNSLEEYRLKWPVLVFDANWSTWEQVANAFVPRKKREYESPAP